MWTSGVNAFVQIAIIRHHGSGMRAHYSLVGPVLTHEWQVFHWVLVLFKDVSRFTVGITNRQERVLRHHGECHAGD